MWPQGPFIPLHPICQQPPTLSAGNVLKLGTSNVTAKSIYVPTAMKEHRDTTLWIARKKSQQWNKLDWTELQRENEEESNSDLLTSSTKGKNLSSHTLSLISTTSTMKGWMRTYPESPDPDYLAGQRNKTLPLNPPILEED